MIPSTSILNDSDLGKALLSTPDRGHVFVVHGDLTKLACDAWMLPTDEDLKIEKSWIGCERLQIPCRPNEWGNHQLRVMRIMDPGDFCQPFLVNVGGIKLAKCSLCLEATAVVHCEADDAELCARCDDRLHGLNHVLGQHKRDFCEDIRWYIEGARAFFKEVSMFLNGKPAKNGRSKHLVGLPLVGTGMGGARESAGGVVALLIPELYRAASEYGFDVSLVLNERSKFAAIQVMRHRFSHAWSLLNPSLRKSADELALHARRGNLVLFLGAGISHGAGLPTWSSLLSDLARDAGLGEDEIKTLSSMSHLDSARVIELHLGGTERLEEAVANRCAVKHYSQASCLLAGLPVKEAVTTNYNMMFERASCAAGFNVAVLPYSPTSNCDRWLLKLHGCTSHPKDIVLTREDYLRYATRRSALQGIVQSLLITRHMLFVGFSLTDDNFHRVVDEVRKSVRPETTNAQDMRSVEPFGTSLCLVRNRVSDMLWKEDLNMVAMQEVGTSINDSSSDTAEAARQLEIFLDYLSAQSTMGAQYLLQPAFDALLTENQRALRDALVSFVDVIPEAARFTDEWSRVEQMLEELGGNHLINRYDIKLSRDVLDRNHFER